MTDAFNNRLNVGDMVYYCSLDNPNGTYRTPCKMYKGVIVKLTDYYATIEVKNEANDTYYQVKKTWNKIGLVQRNYMDRI